MLDSTLELITQASQAASQPLFIFCFCNLIIVIILVGSKPGSNFDQESDIPLYVVTSAHTNYKEGLHAKHISYEQKPLPMISEVSHAHNSLTEENKGNNNDNNINNNINVYEEEEEEEDELRKRIEEFIAKVNKEWKAEMLRTTRLI